MIVLTLSSNSSSTIYPNNEPGHFQTLLPTDLRLDGSGWMIGLARIQFPRTWPILTDSDCTFKIYKIKPSVQIIVKISEDNFVSTENFIEHINKLIEDAGSKLTTGQKAATGIHETRFKLGNHGRLVLTAYSDLGIEMSQKLQQILGLNTNRIITDSASRPTKFEIITKFSSSPPDVDALFNVLWVYSDIIEEQIVSDTKAPLLATVSTVQNNSDNFITYEPKTIDWLKPSGSRFQTITTSIHDITGKIVNFLYGEVIITLHIVKHGSESDYPVE